MTILTSYSCPITPPKNKYPNKRFDLLKPLRRWIDQIQITNRWAAHWLCRVIPSRCPFEREFSLFGRMVHTPALCRVNPVYDEIVSLRLRALTYLADTCGEDITVYIS